MNYIHVKIVHGAMCNNSAFNMCWYSIKMGMIVESMVQFKDGHDYGVHTPINC